MTRVVIRVLLLTLIALSITIFYIYVRGYSEFSEPVEYNFPVWSPDKAMFAVNGCRTRGLFSRCEGLYLVRSNGISEQLVSDEYEIPFDFEWTRDQKEILFTARIGSNYDIYTVDISTKALRNLTEDKFSDVLPALSPDGSQIAYISYQNNPQIYIMSIKGKDSRLVFDLKQAGFHIAQIPPKWSDDRQMIHVMLSDEKGNKQEYSVRVVPLP